MSGGGRRAWSRAVEPSKAAGARSAAGSKLAGAPRAAAPCKHPPGRPPLLPLPLPASCRLPPPAASPAPLAAECGCWQCPKFSGWSAPPGPPAAQCRCGCRRGWWVERAAGGRRVSGRPHMGLPTGRPGARSQAASSRRQAGCSHHSLEQAPAPCTAARPPAAAVPASVGAANHPKQRGLGRPSTSSSPGAPEVQLFQGGAALQACHRRQPVALQAEAAQRAQRLQPLPNLGNAVAPQPQLLEQGQVCQACRGGGTGAAWHRGGSRGAGSESSRRAG